MYLICQTCCTGLRLCYAKYAIHPGIVNGSVSDGATELGLTNARFKARHLSGKAYVGSMNLDAGNADGIKISSTAPYLFFNDTDTAHSYDGSISQSGTTLYVGGATPAQGIVFRNKASFGESSRLDTSGNLLVGTTSTAPYASSSDTAQGIAIRGDFGLIGASRPNNYSLSLNRADSDGEIVNLRKSGSTVGRISSTSTGIALGTPLGSGSGIHLVSNAILPSTSTGGAADGSKDLGSSSNRFKDIYATNGTIQTSDINEKQDIEDL